jgi:hypothetical protein
MAYDKAYEAAQRAKGSADATHGTLATYRYRRCRCELCVARNSRAQREREAAAQASGFAGYEHGTATCYRVGCRCPACKMGQSLTRLLKLQAKDALCTKHSQPNASKPAMEIASPLANSAAA